MKIKFKVDDVSSYYVMNFPPKQGNILLVFKNYYSFSKEITCMIEEWVELQSAFSLCHFYLIP